MAYRGGHKNVHAQIICEYWKIASALYSDACLGQKGIVCCQLAMYAYIQAIVNMLVLQSFRGFSEAQERLKRH